MPRLLVTGGSGYLGRAILRRAAGRWAIHGTCLTSTPGATIRRLDVRDPGAVDRLVADLRPDAVIHTAYVQSGPDLTEVTALGAERVARASRRAGARLIHLSTDVVFDGEAGRPYLEDDPPTPITDYGAAKAAAEDLVRSAHPGALVVRTSLIYGGPEPGPQERLVAAAVREPASTAFFTDEIRSPVQVGDLAAALLELADRDESGILHVAGADDVSRHELAVLLATSMGLDAASLRSASSRALGLTRPRDCALDSARARAMLTARLRGVRGVTGGGPAA